MNENDASAKLIANFLLRSFECSASKFCCFVGNTDVSDSNSCRQCISSYVCSELKKALSLLLIHSLTLSAKNGKVSINKVTQKYFGANRDQSKECRSAEAV